jgi:hypothetical protein
LAPGIIRDSLYPAFSLPFGVLTQFADHSLLCTDEHSSLRLEMDGKGCG